MTRSIRVPLRGHDRRSVWRRGVLRRILAAVLLAAAVYAVTTALVPAPPDPGPVVVVATSDLAVGDEITADSVRPVRMPVGLVPDGALSDPASAHGALTTAPLRAGEVITDLRVSPRGPLEGLDPDLVLAHLPLTEPDLSAILGPGTRVDVLATVDGAVLATDILVVQRVPGADATGVTQSFLVAVTPSQAARLAAAAGADLPGQGLTVVIRR
ncbi:SAF domain-containing protein [Ornithinimicrobium cryptoxanthini]|uniref:SAF domain-containing protein n=1 Tax=Ornithinimicrobium cryptoxanthini TaxID=2934161 RepID=A0ABY4YGE1_9MICO|nr:SAF domain-containing protein [Ornithinimicrobium cryptoxanthini]USQ75835.1 SAF domain-containing protein [Ornithinimicrobium cryptoxanthini]